MARHRLWGLLPRRPGGAGSGPARGARAAGLGRRRVGCRPGAVGGGPGGRGRSPPGAAVAGRRRPAARLRPGLPARRPRVDVARGAPVWGATVAPAIDAIRGGYACGAWSAAGQVCPPAAEAGFTRPCEPAWRDHRQRGHGRVHGGGAVQTNDPHATGTRPAVFVASIPHGSAEEEVSMMINASHRVPG